MVASRIIAPALALVLCVLHPDPAVAALRTTSKPPPPRPQVQDLIRRLDLNQINMWATNFGSLAWDLTTGSPGFIYPRGSGKTAIFASGLWLGARVGSEVRVAVAEYSQEYGPGAMVGGTFDDPNRPEYVVYKVVRFTGDPQDTAHVDRTPAELAADPQLDPLLHHSWSEYMSGAVPYGAPWQLYRLPVTSTPMPDDSVDVPGPRVSGDMMLWTVFNDADPNNHNNNAGSTLPLGVEVRMTAFAFDRPGPLGNTVFVSYQLLNQGSQTLEDMFVAPWSDPDIGDFTDDLSGCDTTLGLGYAYNGQPTDGVYGNNPPAVGYDLLRGPSGPGGPLGLYSFTRYINGTDPASFDETYLYMNGLHPDGSPIVNPVNGETTRYMFSGDPVTGLGWNDSSPADRRMLLASGPITMAPGDRKELTFAIVVGQGNSARGSITALRCADKYVQRVFDGGLAEPFPPFDECPEPVNCPRSAAFWSDECASGGNQLTPVNLGPVAACVNQSSAFFQWGNDLDGFCAALGGGDARAQAKREFAALVANVCGSQLGVRTINGQPIALSPLTPISCPGLAATTIGELTATANLTPHLYRAAYLNHVTTNRRPIEGINWNGNLALFNGGAGYGFDFLGSSLDPNAMPDSFSTVVVGFSATVTQRAYRFLRLERQSDGQSPPQGRAYLYAGFLDVPFTCRDSAGNVLDVAFVERTLTDDFGTILPPASQPATHDSTWGPDDSGLGGREYLLVTRRPYAGSPRPEIAYDGAPIDGTLPALYALWSRRRSASDVFDDGDGFEFSFGIAPSNSLDLLLYQLEGRPLGDPDVQQAYADIVACAGNINAGIGIGPTCDQPTPALVSLAGVEAETGWVRITWQAADPSFVATVERHPPGGEWSEVARVSADGRGMLSYEDRSVVAGDRYGYRLREVASPADVLGETWVDVPSYRLELAGIRPNPTGGPLLVSFSLPNRERATLELLDVAGRRLASREVGALGPGAHRVRLEPARRLAAGLYVVRLTQGARILTAKAAILR